MHDDFGEQLDRCTVTLEQFRQLAERVQDRATRARSAESIVEELVELSHLGLPEADIEIKIEADLAGLMINADSTLIPALLNLIHNAAKANTGTGKNRIEVTARERQQELMIAVRDYGAGIPTDLLQELGESTVESAQGLGMAVFFSNATLERLGGRLELSNLDEGAQARVYLPLLDAPRTL
ncbi:MAG: ATP-binding protein [Pirellulaceae bacterium]|nr:ATP-binding protein [Pirellulaceae bacterium]